MNFIVTDVGLAAATVAAGGPAIHLGNFKLGTSTTAAAPGDTDVIGTVVYTGTVAAVLRVDDNTADIVVQIPASAGPFNFAEICLFTNDVVPVLFARGVYPTLQQQVRDASSGVGSVWTFHCLVQLQGIAAVLDFTSTLSAIVPTYAGSAVLGPDITGADTNLVLARLKTPNAPSSGTSTIALKRESATQWTPTDYLYRGAYTVNTGATTTLANATDANLWRDPIATSRPYLYLLQDVTGKIVTATSNGDGTATLSYACAWMTAGATFRLYEFRGDDYDTNIPVVDMSLVRAPGKMGFNCNVLYARTASILNAYEDSVIMLKKLSAGEWTPEGWTHRYGVTAQTGSNSTTLVVPAGSPLAVIGSIGSNRFLIQRASDGAMSMVTADQTGSCALQDPISDLASGDAFQIYEPEAFPNSVGPCIPIFFNPDLVRLPNDHGGKVNAILVQDKTPQSASDRTILLTRDTAAGRWSLQGYREVGQLTPSARSGLLVTSSRFYDYNRDLAHNGPAYRYMLMLPSTGQIVPIASINIATGVATLARTAAWLTTSTTVLVFDGGPGGNHAVFSGDNYVNGSQNIYDPSYNPDAAYYDKAAVRRFPPLGSGSDTTYTINASASGRQVRAQGPFTIPGGIFREGEYFWLQNSGSADANVIPGSGVLFTNNFDGSGGSFTLAAGSMCYVFARSPYHYTFDGVSMAKTAFDGLGASLTSVIIDIVYKVGTVIIREDDSDPNADYAGTTWVRTAVGRMYIGKDASDPDFDTVGVTGGEKTHTLTAAEVPALGVRDRYYPEAASAEATATYKELQGDPGAPPTGYNGNVGSHSTDPDNNAYLYFDTMTTTGGGGAHNNLPPYTVVSKWKRTA
jgi:hypothetical protein